MGTLQILKAVSTSLFKTINNNNIIIVVRMGQTNDSKKPVHGNDSGQIIYELS